MSSMLVSAFTGWGIAHGIKHALSIVRLTSQSRTHHALNRMVNRPVGSHQRWIAEPSIRKPSASGTITAPRRSSAMLQAQPSSGSDAAGD